jgi:hypothetical protein
MIQTRDPALAEMVRATVRVEQGAGFLVRNSSGQRIVVTARHVVAGRSAVMLRWPGGSTSGTVLTEDKSSDLAIVTDSPAMPGKGMQLLPSSESLSLGDPIWLAGFPDGWQDLSPVIGQGVIAGIGTETWINADGTWGNSGGPVVVVREGAPFVVGAVLRRGGEAERALQDAIQTLRESRDRVAAATRNSNLMIPGLDVVGFVRYSANAFAALADFIRDHFRSGYVAIASRDQIASIMGA